MSYRDLRKIPTDIDTEQDRIIFIKSVAQFMATKAHIKLNAKKLYQADGYAVKELIKVTSVLYNAMRTNPNTAEDTQSSDTSPMNFDISSKIGDLKDARRLASEITAKGAKLYDLLGKETDLREQRSVVIARQLDINEVEKGLAQSVKGVEGDIKKTLNLIENVAADEANLEAKITKKKSEVDRLSKQFNVIKGLRPAHMDEYEALEKELDGLYEKYMEKYRNQTYLEQQLEEYNTAEQDRFEETEMNLRRMAEKIKNEEKTISAMQPDDAEDDMEGLVDDDGGETESEEETKGPQRPTHGRQRPGEQPAQQQGAAAGGRVVGSMGMDIEDDDDDPKTTLTMPRIGGKKRVQLNLQPTVAKATEPVRPMGRSLVAKATAALTTRPALKQPAAEKVKDMDDLDKTEREVKVTAEGKVKETEATKKPEAAANDDDDDVNTDVSDHESDMDDDSDIDIDGDDQDLEDSDDDDVTIPGGPGAQGNRNQPLEDSDNDF